MHPWSHHSKCVAYMYLITSAREDCNRRCLFVCLLATLRKNFWTDLHEIFRECWQLGNEQTVTFWWRSRIRIRIADTGKTCLGGGMHCLSASSYYMIGCPSYNCTGNPLLLGHLSTNILETLRRDVSKIAPLPQQTPCYAEFLKVPLT